MGTKKLIWVLFGILVVSAWILGSAIQAGAAIKNYKYFNYTTKVERFSVGDVDGHRVSLLLTKTFLWFEDGEVAITDAVVTSDLIKSSGTYYQYGIWKFPDGSTIIIKLQGTTGVAGVSAKSEILKGTGRFEGIKGTSSAKGKYLPPQEGDVGPMGYGEGTLTYTMPTK